MQRRRGAIPGLLRRLALCTLAGAVVTWAVAWGIAAASARPRYGPPLEHEPARPWPPGVPEGWPPAVKSFSLSSPGHLRQAWYHTYRPAKHQYDLAVLKPGAYTDDYGAPFLAMRAMLVQQPTGQFYRTVWYEAPVTTSNPIFLPTQILPIGFALNTALAALVLLAMVEGVGLARRRRRANRGLCTACGYDRRGIGAGGVCPECGGAGK